MCKHFLWIIPLTKIPPAVKKMSSVLVLELQKYPPLPDCWQNTATSQLTSGLKEGDRKWGRERDADRFFVPVFLEHLCLLRLSSPPQYYILKLKIKSIAPALQYWHITSILNTAHNGASKHTYDTECDKPACNPCVSSIQPNACAKHGLNSSVSDVKQSGHTHMTLETPHFDHNERTRWISGRMGKKANQSLKGARILCVSAHAVFRCFGCTSSHLLKSCGIK